MLNIYYKIQTTLVTNQWKYNDACNSVLPHIKIQVVTAKFMDDYKVTRDLPNIKLLTYEIKQSKIPTIKSVISIRAS